MTQKYNTCSEKRKKIIEKVPVSWLALISLVMQDDDRASSEETVAGYGVIAERPVTRKRPRQECELATSREAGDA